MEKINIYFGSDSRFEEAIKEVTSYKLLSDVTAHLNKTQIAIDGVKGEGEQPLAIENLIINTDDYGGIKEWAMLSFSSSILKDFRLDIKNVWMNNPPKKIYEDVKKHFPEQTADHSEDRKTVDLEVIKNVAAHFEERIIGQDAVKNKMLTSLYALLNPNRRRPVAILFLGESGVGKTETAKFINSYMDGEMVRVQFSMQQTAEAYKYIFGADHGEDSLARELIRRESNVVLLDEFDKVHSSMYNAFYQMFDEGIFVDNNYEVDVRGCVIICTSNFKTEQEAEKILGSPIYSRFTKVITFNPISIENKIKIAEMNYRTLFAELSEEDQQLIENNNVLSFYISHIKKGLYSNMRMLRNDIEEALNYEILKSRGII